MILDLKSVRLFILSAEYGSLTRAAEAAGTVQPVASQRLKALEQVLGYKLLDRSPRFVRLTDPGLTFLTKARILMAAHEDALAFQRRKPLQLSIGVSDHALGAFLEVVLARLRAVLPQDSIVKVWLGQSQEVRALYEQGAVDVAIIRREGSTGDGEYLGSDPVEWVAPVGWQASGRPIPLVTLPPPCGVRAVAIKSLERAGLQWRDAFVGGSCLALAAAVRGGLGVAPLGRMGGGHSPGLSPVQCLPPLPSSKVLMLTRASAPGQADAARALAASVREILGRPMIDMGLNKRR
ncbi:MAG: LysR substrate-binding domain-containing protein [Pseudorhizobium sp.]